VGKKRKKTYTPIPEVPEEIRERYLTMLAVQSGEMTVSEGARRLGMARNHFQSMMNRGLQGLLEGVTPKRPGRPPVPEAEAKLRAENERLRRENERLKAQVQNTHHLIELAADVFNRRLAKLTGSRETKRTTTEKTDDDVEDDLRDVDALREMGLCPRIAAAVAGVGASTVRRWRQRNYVGLALRAKRGPHRRSAPLPAIVEQVTELVHDLHGLIGADALRHAVPGVSRRQAAAIKHDTRTAMERERIAACERVHIPVPGVVRGMDAMYEMTTDGWRWLLLFGDASVPYRTSAYVVERYNSDSVAASIDADFTENGAPLVWRVDRASAHRTDDVAAVLDAWSVLALHGPAHHPGFYGQQERQNRDNRAWLDVLATPTPDDLHLHVPRMLHALNTRWPRRALEFKTPAELWNARPKLDVDRRELRDEVHRDAEQRRRNVSDDLAMRLAIEKALTRRGWLRREVGGWC
jgi:transposase-like protein